jgi:Domain of unknown function (DUF932)
MRATREHNDMSSNGPILTAHNEWSRRPDEDRSATVQEWTSKAKDDAANCGERIYSARDLRVEVATVGGGEQPILVSPKGSARFSNWAFGQTCRLVKAPAAYVQSLPARLAAECLSYGLDAVRGDLGFLKLYARKPDESGLPTLRAVTTDSYQRVTDGSIGDSLIRLFLERGSVNGHEWQIPKDWQGRPSGAYRSDRDSFVFLIDGGSMVTDPSVKRDGGGGGEMYRGIMVSNSEVGAKSISMDAVLFRAVCGNLMVWGAAYDRRFSRRHVGAVDSRFRAELTTLAAQWTQQSPARDEALVRYMIDNEVAATEKGVLSFLKDAGLGVEDAKRAYERAERLEWASPRSYWGIVNGITRISQDEAFTGDRITLDMQAAAITARAAKLVKV